jgi:hypothetical protein
LRRRWPQLREAFAGGFEEKFLRFVKLSAGDNVICRLGSVPDIRINLVAGRPIGISLKLPSRRPLSITLAKRFALFDMHIAGCMVKRLFASEACDELVKL